MIDNYTCRVVLEDELQCVEKRACRDTDFPDADDMPAILAGAIHALNRARAVAFLAEVVRDSCEFGYVAPSNVADQSAEERFLDAAYDVVKAWTDMDSRLKGNKP